MQPRIAFVIGGVQKGGTTALASFMVRHPRIALPKGKEAHVFDAPDFDETWSISQVEQRYQPYFEQERSEAMHGDATPIYCFHPRLIQRIADYNPRMKWIVILRHPVERALSHYHMERSRRWEHWPLWPALLLERWRLRGHAEDFSSDSPLRRFSYRARGDYARQLDGLYRHFPKSQVLVLRNEDLASQPMATLGRVWAFLGVEALAAGAAGDFPRVFEGDYRRQPRRGWRWAVLNLFFRRSLNALDRDHGIRW